MEGGKRRRGKRRWGVEKHPLVGGYLYTSAVIFSIGATAGVLYREVVRWWEGQLREVPLYVLQI